METINRKILVTGSAGFNGSALVLRFLTVELMDQIVALEKALGKFAENRHSICKPNVPDTYADLVKQFHYQSVTTVEEGLQRFGAWYRNELKLI